MRVPTTLIDARNIEALLPRLKDEVAAAPLLGFDIETHNERAHDGIKEYRKKDGAKAFDYRRMDVTGFSWYVPDAPRSYYLNLGHADRENRVPWPLAKQVLDVRSCPLVIHNDPFERTVMKNSLDWDVGETICTLQLAVSCFGPDEYNVEDLGRLYQWPITNLVPQIAHAFTGFDRSSYEMTTQQAKLLGKVVGKESHAEWSYNGFNTGIAYGYGLKKLVRNLLHEEITDFQTALGGAPHMGAITGEQAADYGGDDSYFAVQVLYKLLGMIKPEALAVFETQENPMTRIYAAIQQGGCRIDSGQVDERRKTEEQNRVDTMDKLKELVQSLLPFPDLPHSELSSREDWYAKNWQKYRKMLSEWKRADKKPLNLTHYMPVRVLLYDLCGLSLLLEKGKVQSDGEARGQLLEKATGPAIEVIKSLNGLAGIDQRIKLYLKPYKLLIDPETDKVYPSVSSRLATRRLAGSNPNPMQLAKAGESAYIRSFYLPDSEDDV